jgi:predicted RNA binding protein YcfA (HicA-like mRNA interferase family)
MKTSELIRVLKDAGCVLDRHGRRHDRWRNPKTGAFEWVPRHAAEVKTGLAKAILKELVGE